MFDELLNSIPLWVVLLVLTILFVVTSEIFFKVGARARARKSSKITSESISDLVPTSILGLLALLLGFTFSMAITRFETRKNLVLKEANAIGTTYLRTELLPQNAQDKVKSLLKEYTALRVDFFKYKSGSEAAFNYYENTQIIQNKIWKLAMEAAKTDRSAPFAQFIVSLNEMIDLDAERIHASHDKVPGAVIFIIVFIALFGLSTLGFINGCFDNRRYSTVLLAILFAVVIVLILDLDRPGRGWIQIHPDALITLQRSWTK